MKGVGLRDERCRFTGMKGVGLREATGNARPARAKIGLFSLKV